MLVSGLDPVIPKGRIIQDVSDGLDPVIPKGRIVLCMYVLALISIGSSAKTLSCNSERKDCLSTTDVLSMIL